MPFSPRRFFSAWFRLYVRRDRGRNPARDWAFSAVLLLGAVLLGLSALPSDLTGAASALRLNDPARADSGIAPAVFALRDDGRAVRFGQASLSPTGIIRVGLYDPNDALLTRATEAVSVPGDARLLWLLASPSEREDLRGRAGALAVSATSGFRDILASPEFAEHYRERFVAVLGGAIRETWQETQDSGAWRALIRGSEPVLRDVLARDLRPTLDKQFRGVPMALLRANAMTIVDPFTDRAWNMQPVEDALKAALVELRDRGAAERIVGRVMDAPSTAAFLRGFQDSLARKLAQGSLPRELIAEMIFDARLRPYIAEAIDRTNDLGRAAPRLLVSLHGSKEPNMVSSTVVRTMVSGRSDRVVLFVSPAQRDELLRLDPGTVRVLQRNPA